MTATCTLCGRPASVGRLCFRHYDRLADLLDPAQAGTSFDPTRPGDFQVKPSIPVLFGRLDPAPPLSGIPAGGSHVARSAPPCNLHILALRDPRSRATGPGRDDDGLSGPWSAQTVLRDLADMVDRRSLDGAAEAKPGPRATVTELSAWLHQRVDWIAAQDWVGEAWEELRTLHSQLLAAAGDPNPAPVGTCRAVVDDDGAEDPGGRWRCGQPLYLPASGPKAPDEPVELPALRCSSCGHRYSGTELILLGRQHEGIPA